MSLKILVVDDDALTLKLLTRALTSEGFAVKACGDSHDALELLRTGDFDVLLTDFVMPRMLGGELANAARSLRPELRCFIMSGLAKVDEVSDVVWLQKPLDIASLVALLTG